MKKILSLTLIVVLMCGVLISCGNGDEQKSTQNHIDNAASTTEVTTTTTKSAEILSDQNSKIFIDGLLEAELVDTYFTDEITEEKNGMISIHPNHDKGSLYLAVIKFKLSNISSKELYDYDITSDAKLIYDDTYEYDGIGMSLKNLVPLCEEYFYVYYKVPKKVMDGKEPVVAHFSIGENSYTVNVR